VLVGDSTIGLPYVNVGWRHDFMDESVPVTARFASGAGNEFTVHGTELGSDSVALNVGLSIQWNLQFNTYFSYSTEMGRDGYQLHNLNGGFRVSF
jgi:outer membrane autotransporter protein